VIDGKGTVADTFTSDNMSRLPLDNYVDIVVPLHWINYYQSLSPDSKVSLYVKIWEACDEEERRLIIGDLHFFFIDSKKV
jgi:hypothetical protein